MMDQSMGAVKQPQSITELRVALADPETLFRAKPRLRRRIFFLVDSLNVGGTETQAVELARRLDTDYDVTPGCLRARGPLMERFQNSTVSAIRFSLGQVMAN
jgi:hypothetical protein